MNALIQMKKKTTIDTKMKKGNLSFFFFTVCFNSFLPFSKQGMKHFEDLSFMKMSLLVLRKLDNPAIEIKTVDTDLMIVDIVFILF